MNIYLFLLLSVMMYFLFSCSASKEEENTKATTSTQRNQVSVDTLVDTQFSDSTRSTQEEEILPHQKQFMESYKKAVLSPSRKDFDNGKFGNEKLNYTTQLSELTGLNHLQFCEVAAKLGIHAIDEIVEAMPNENPNKEEAQRIIMLVRFNRMSLPPKSKEYLLSKKDKTLSQKEQLESYLYPYQEAARLRFNINEKPDLKPTIQKKSSQLAKLINIDFEQIALIEEQLGTLGLRSMVLNIPDFPQKEKALEILSEK